MDTDNIFTVGVLALQGDIEEHLAVLKMLEEEKKDFKAIKARTAEEIASCDALIIPGGESTTFSRLVEYYGLYQAIRGVPSIMGTCAGAIMLAKKVRGSKQWQKTLMLMDIEVLRNAYGTQTDSFSQDLDMGLGGKNQRITATFIRAPVIAKAWGSARVIATLNTPVAVEQEHANGIYLALAFHPELDTEIIHRYFIETAIRKAKENRT